MLLNWITLFQIMKKLRFNAPHCAVKAEGYN